MYTLQSDLTQVPQFSGAQYDKFLQGSALAGWGNTFAQVGAKYGVNPIYLMALTIFESGWGKSNFARTRNNFWGYAAFDHNVNLAATFTSPSQGLEFIAHWLKNTWLTPPRVVNGKKILYQLLPYQVGKETQYSTIGYWWVGEPTLEAVYKIGKYEGKAGKYATAPHAAYSMLDLMNQILSFLGNPDGGVVIISNPIPQDNTSVQQYTVVSGDSLWKIAQKFYNDPQKWHDIATANGITGPNYVIHTGQVLKLPGKNVDQSQSQPSNEQRTYTVAAGDSLWSIAARYYGAGTRYLDIYNANRDQLDTPNLIRVGQQLRIP